MDSKLTVSVMLWGRSAPTHVITCVYLIPGTKILLTGSENGQICIWHLAMAGISPSLLPVAKLMLYSHSGAVSCFCVAGQRADKTRFVSASEKGELFLWDAADGLYIDRSHRNLVHTHIQYQIFDPSSTCLGHAALFCCGHYNEILILDPSSLNPLLSLSARVEPDWVMSFCLLRPPNKFDIVVGLTRGGLVKMWTLDLKKESRQGEALFEDESKQVQCAQVHSLRCCPFTPRAMLVCGSYLCQLYDAVDFSLLCQLSAPRECSWLGADFIRTDVLVAFCSDGQAYIYQLPKCGIIAQKASTSILPKQPLLCCILQTPTPNLKLSTDPCFLYSRSISDNHYPAGVVFRADATGRLAVWAAPQINEKVVSCLLQEELAGNPLQAAVSVTSLEELWKQLAANACPPKGIVDHLPDGADWAVSCSLLVSTRGRLLLGRSDGSILIIAVTETIMKQMLQMAPTKPPDWPLHRVLSGGHRGAVTCLLYPHESYPQRYSAVHLLSGGLDFSVCLWELSTGSLLHRFCHQAGQIQRLLVPPDNCSNRVLTSVCSVASDHSVALLSLKECKCVLLASKHLFPVTSVRWRPLDDFLLVLCADGSLYVWQMDTGHLDRIVVGIYVEDVLAATQEQLQLGGQAQQDDAYANTAVQMFRAIKYKNIQAVKKIAEGVSGSSESSAAGSQVSRGFADIPWAPPLQVHGLRTHPKDADAHLLLFNVEALILELIRFENGNSLQSASQQSTALPEQSSPLLSGFLGRMREKADDIGQKLQSAAGSAIGVGGGGQRSEPTSGAADGTQKRRFSLASHPLEGNYELEVAQLLLSFLHAWQMDNDLDKVCVAKLGLYRPAIPICFGIFSPEGHFGVQLPQPDWWSSNMQNANELASKWAKSSHWHSSCALTTTHLLSCIGLANTLMAMPAGASFAPDYERRRRLLRRRQTELTAVGMTAVSAAGDAAAASAADAAVVSQMKQGWSLLAALHCVLLPELASQHGVYRPPIAAWLAGKWQDRCLELREAAQALLLRELARIGSTGRQQMIERWAPLLPSALDASLSLFEGKMSASAAPSSVAQSPLQPADVTMTTGVDSGASQAGSDSAQSADQSASPSPSSTQSSSVAAGVSEVRRQQATAVIILGVIAAEYPQQVQQDHQLLRNLSMSLLELLIHPHSASLPLHSSLRRSAIDLLGRGFPVWQPYLDISRVLLGLLHFCAQAEKIMPSGPLFLPLSAPADSCRSARHALALIACSRTPAFITALSKEVTRFYQQQSGGGGAGQHVHLQNSPLVRAKAEVMRVFELLSDKHQHHLLELMQPFGEILTFCLDGSALTKQKLLREVFPAAPKFPMIAWCRVSSRLAFGAKHGVISLHELKGGSKPQVFQAHSKGVTALAFSEDGKHLCSYCCEEGRLGFWACAQGFLNISQAQVRMSRMLQAPQESLGLNPDGTAQLFRARIVWISPRSVTLILPNGKEHRMSM